MINRREFFGLAAGAGAVLAVPPALLRALQQPDGQLIQRAIPSTGELLPVISFGPRATEGAAFREVLTTLVDNGGRVVDVLHGGPAGEQGARTAARELGIQDQLFWTTPLAVTIPVLPGHTGPPPKVDPAAVRAAMEEKLANLSVPSIDLVLVLAHADVPTHLAVLREMKKEGRVRYIGVAELLIPEPTATDRLESIMRSESIDLSNRRAASQRYSRATRRGIADRIPIHQDGTDALMRYATSINRAVLTLATLLPVAACGTSGPGNPTEASPNQTLFTYRNAVAYLPPGVAEYKAAIVFLPGLRDPATGNPLDSRGLVRGTTMSGCSIWCSASERAEVRSRALELVGGNVALIGTTTVLNDAAGYATLLDALSGLGTQSMHPELATIPILFVGHSMGGCTAYGFSRVHGARVAGFLTMKGGCHNPGSSLAAADVPGYFLIGERDAPHRRDNITAVFETGRASGSPWALSVDPFGHGPILDFDLMFDWIDSTLTERLPETPGAPLRSINESDGWLGNRSTGAISTYACFGATRSSASWLPDRATAVNWQRMAGGTAVVSAC